MSYDGNDLSCKSCFIGHGYEVEGAGLTRDSCGFLCENLCATIKYGEVLQSMGGGIVRSERVKKRKRGELLGGSYKKG